MTTSKPEVMGFATHHDEPMLFPSSREAMMYCNDEEEPVALIRLSDHQRLQAECEKLRKNMEWYQIRLEVIRNLCPSAPSNTELDIAINAAMQIDRL